MTNQTLLQIKTQIADHKAAGKDYADLQVRETLCLIAARRVQIQAMLMDIDHKIELLVDDDDTRNDLLEDIS